MSRIPEHLKRRGQELCEWLDSGIAPEDLVIWDDDLGQFEHAIHELGHMVSLGILPKEKGSRAVGILIGQLPHAAQVLNEALVFAAEAHVLNHYGLLLDDSEEPSQGAIYMGDIYDHAGVQGCTKEQVDLFLDDDASYEIAERIIEHIENPNF